jgi:quinol monooxygenase YgiN
VELFTFVRFHVRAGTERAAEEALRNVLAASRQEPGCLRMHLYRSTRDPQLFYIHSQWVAEDAFDQHASLPHTLHFLEVMESLVDQPRDVARTELII